MAYASWSVVFGEQPSAAKWNILGTNDASFNDGTGIAVSAITPEKLLTGTGTTWAWASWTPTFANFTKGSATVVAKYIQIGKTVHFRLSVVLSGSTMGTSPTFTLPVTSASDYEAEHPIGVATSLDTGVIAFPGLTRWLTTTTGDWIVYGQGSTNINSVGVLSTTPHTWGNGDKFYMTGTYQAA